MEDMNFYNKHYIRIREDGCIIDGFSDAFREPDEDSICINEQGGYQFRLHYLVYDPTYELTWHHWESEENPPLFDWNGMIPLYKYEGGYVRRRTEEEIEADRAEIPAPEATPTTEERLSAVEETTAQQGEILNILLSGETGAGV